MKVALALSLCQGQGNYKRGTKGMLWEFKLMKHTRPAQNLLITVGGFRQHQKIVSFSEQRFILRVHIQ